MNIGKYDGGGKKNNHARTPTALSLAGSWASSEPSDNEYTGRGRKGGKGGKGGKSKASKSVNTGYDKNASGSSEWNVTGTGGGW